MEITVYINEDKEYLEVQNVVHYIRRSTIIGYTKAQRSAKYKTPKGDISFNERIKKSGFVKATSEQVEQSNFLTKSKIQKLGYKVANEKEVKEYLSENGAKEVQASPVENKKIKEKEVDKKGQEA